MMSAGDSVPNNTYTQIEGRGHRMRADALRKAIEQSSELHRRVLRFVHSFLTQSTRTERPQ